jgi:hypothetical protein
VSSVSNLKPGWPKGVSGNPGGKPKLPKELKAIPGITSTEISRIISKYARMSVTELKAIVSDESYPSFESAVCAVLLRCIQYGDFLRLNFLCEKAAGKDSPIDFSTDDDPEMEKIRAMPVREALKYIQSKLPEE